MDGKNKLNSVFESLFGVIAVSLLSGLGLDFKVSDNYCERCVRTVLLCANELIERVIRCSIKFIGVNTTLTHTAHKLVNLCPHICYDMFFCNTILPLRSCLCMIASISCIMCSSDVIMIY